MPERAQPPDIGVVGDVRPLNGIAQVMQNLGDPAHSDAADPDEMDRPDIEREGPLMLRYP